MRLVKALALTGLALLFACQTTPPAVIPQPPILQVPQIPSGPPPKPKIALVLGGGAARGFAHVGVIRALEQEKIPIDMVIGTSVGSLIGAIYASDVNSFDLEWTAFQLEKEDIFDFGVLNAVTGMGFAKGDKLEAWVKGHIKTANIEQMKIPFAAVAADLNWGYKVVLDKGSVARAIRASAAIPGVFQPVQHQGKILVDGGVVDNIPISVAKAKGADLVIAVDISSNLGNPNITNLLGVSLQATNIMFALNVEQSKKAADVLIAPAGIGDVGMLDFTQKKRCMQAGIDATKESMPRIRQAIDTWVAARTRPASTTP
ncbi:MAG: patatin-like phospholipase family protein [Geothrix sp.]|jgi:NTE family protein|nr:patatin-like phospholipase family protein [Geothrix sp.]